MIYRKSVSLVAQRRQFLRATRHNTNRSDAQRTRLSIPFGNFFPQTGLGSVSSTVQSSFEIEQIFLQLLLILLNRHVIDPGRFPSFQSAKGIPQQLNGEQREDVVKRLPGMRFRASGDAIQAIHNRVSAAGCRRF